jgi:hypothetical protein
MPDVGSAIQLLIVALIVSMVRRKTKHPYTIALVI